MRSTVGKLLACNHVLVSVTAVVRRTTENHFISVLSLVPDREANLQRPRLLKFLDAIF